MNFIVGIILLIVGISVLSGAGQRGRPADVQRGARGVGGVLSLIAVVVMLSSLVKIIPPGHVGVVVIFGKVNQNELKEGINIVNPFATVEKMTIKTQEITERMNVPSNEGLTVNLDMSLLYKVNPEFASKLFQTVGPRYREVIILPTLRSAARTATVNFEAKMLYTIGREEVSQQLTETLGGMLKERGIILESVLLRSITLPQRVTGAIEEKLEAEQQAERMQFVLEKERLEAQRKELEATGIARAQEIISNTLSVSYLQYLAIQAQKHMADSPNHTTVYIPAGFNGVPLMEQVNAPNRTGGR